MSLDPYTDMAQWLDMDARTEAIMRHPAGKALMSADEAQARMDAEACALGSANWQQPAPAPRRRRWLEVAAPAATTVALVTYTVLDVFILNGPVTA